MPSGESFSNSHELSQLLELKKPNPEQLIKTQLSILNSTNFLQKHTQLENKEKQEFSINFDMDRIWDIGFEEPKKETYLKPEKQGKTENINDKEKLLQYGKLADLSYVNLRTNTAKDGNEKYSFQTTSLDPLTYPNIDKIIAGEKPINLTKEEQKLYNFISNLENIKKIDYSKKIKSENNLLLSRFGLGEQYLAEGGNIKSDIMPETVYSREILKRRYLIDLFLDTEGIIKEAKNNFEDLRKDFTILDYFPNETKNDVDNSGFGAICLEKDGRKYIVIRGTDATDWKDLLEDSKMIVGSIPDKQAKDLIKFIDRNIANGEKFSLAGHSLGGALSQIATAMYKDQIEETYTFNSPGAKNLEVSKEDRQKFAKLDTFMYNREDKEVGEKIVNVKGDKGFSPISNLGEDIGDYEIILKDLQSHGIKDLINYVDRLDENSEELKRINVKDIDNSKQKIIDLDSLEK